MRFTMKRALITAIFIGGALPAAAENSKDQTGSPEYTQEFGSQVRAYLLNNPEVVLEVFTILERQETEKLAKREMERLRSYEQELFYSSSPIKGNPTAPIQIVEFFDYQCGYCKAAASELHKILENRDDVSFVLKEFPILGQTSEDASRIALAIRAEHGDEAYVQFHDDMLNYRGSALNAATLAALVGAAGFDYEALVSRGKENDITSTLIENKKLAQALSINGTPAFVFNDGVVSGMMDAARIEARISKITTTN
ncbi:DsbA family protein [Celeribacter naphthalenivorans]|uniref:DsbA family protein n=1 Tax=Celeribacter naphthalenivorans TaxID=1614694 RepID=UPI001CFB9DB6|nr:DsbA family protein [Celeribacter naphthalenivorans]